MLLGCLSVAGALATAALSLFGHGIAERLPSALVGRATAAVDALRAAHSGHVGDYVAWWTFGMAVVGGLVLWAVAG